MTIERVAAGIFQNLLLIEENVKISSTRSGCFM